MFYNDRCYIKQRSAAKPVKPATRISKITKKPTNSERERGKKSGHPFLGRNKLKPVI